MVGIAGGGALPLKIGIVWHPLPSHRRFYYCTAHRLLGCVVFQYFVYFVVSYNCSYCCVCVLHAMYTPPSTLGLPVHPVSVPCRCRFFILFIERYKLFEKPRYVQRYILSMHGNAARRSHVQQYVIDNAMPFQLSIVLDTKGTKIHTAAFQIH